MPCPWIFLQHIPTPLFVLEIWKACLVGLIESPEGTEELKWTAFTFLKVPGAWSSRRPVPEWFSGKAATLWTFAPCFSLLASCPAFRVPQHKFPSIIFSESPRAIFSPLGRLLLFLVHRCYLAQSSARLVQGSYRSQGSGPWALKRGFHFCL